MIRNVILDWSGTLVDDLPAVWEAVNHVLQQGGGKPLTLEEFRLQFRLPAAEYFQEVLPPGLTAEQVQRWFHERFREVHGSIRPLPHAREFLEFCRARGLRTFVLSAVPPEQYHAQAAAIGFDTLIEGTCLGSLDKRLDIGRFLDSQGLDRAATLFVGDMQHDIEAARHGGVRSVAVLTGYNHLAQLRVSQPDRIVEHLGELRDLLERSGKALEETPVGERRPVGTVGALIRDRDGRVLLLRTHKWSNLWGIPGGKIRYRERSIDALRRELKEETGLDVDRIRFVLVQDCIESTEFYRPDHFLLLNYVCERTGDGEVRLNDEAQAHQWLSPTEALALPLNGPTRRLIEAVLATTPTASPDRIRIEDLEVRFRVGVPEAERSEPQRLLLTVDMERHVAAAAAADALDQTIDYYAVSRRLLALGEGRSWKLIERLAVDVAELILAEYGARAVTVEVRKFVLPEARHVSVRVRREAPAA